MEVSVHVVGPETARGSDNLNSGLDFKNNTLIVRTKPLGRRHGWWELGTLSDSGVKIQLYPRKLYFSYFLFSTPDSKERQPDRAAGPTKLFISKPLRVRPHARLDAAVN